MSSALYEGTLMHARRTPRRNVFRYPVSYFLIDLDDLPDLERRLRFFPWNRRNPVTLRDRDHFGGGSVTAEVRKRAADRWIRRV